MDTKTINLRDLPEDLVRRAKACAALHGMTLKDFVIRAIHKATLEDIPATGLPMAAFATSKTKPRKKA
jgi:plasmid stability protein